MKKEKREIDDFLEKMNIFIDVEADNTIVELGKAIRNAEKLMDNLEALKKKGIKIAVKFVDGNGKAKTRYAFADISNVLQQVDDSEDDHGDS